MEKTKRAAFSLAVIILLSSLGLAADPSTGERTFKARLLGNEEVPPVTTEAVGSATFQTGDGNTMTYTLTVSPIQEITAAMICKGRKCP